MIGVVFYNLESIPNIPIKSNAYNSSTKIKSSACTVQECSEHVRFCHPVNFG